MAKRAPEDTTLRADAVHDGRLAELGAFLRERRRALRPEDAGIVTARRRHVKGLRREEVAERAGIGVSWYTLLEQGRASGVTDRTLERIADALLLTPLERTHLFALARGPLDLSATTDVPAPLLAYVRSIDRGIAFLLTAGAELIAWNDEAERVFGFSTFPHGNRNLIVDLALGGRTRTLIPDWETVLANMVAVLRAQTARRPDPAVTRFVAALSERSETFARLWREQRVDEIPLHVCTIVHPERGRIEVQLFAFTPVHSRDATLIVLVPPQTDESRGVTPR